MKKNNHVVRVTAGFLPNFQNWHRLNDLIIYAISKLLVYCERLSNVLLISVYPLKKTDCINYLSLRNRVAPNLAT